MLIRATRPAVVGVVALLLLTGCQELESVEVVNPCGEAVVVLLWETPTPQGDRNDEPTRVEVPPMQKVTAKDALADVGKDGSSAEIVSGPGKGEVLFMAQGKRLAIVPGDLCVAIE